MSEVILVAFITGGLGLLGNIISNSNSQKIINAKIDANIEFVNHEIKELDKKIEKHNSVIERTYQLEEGLRVLNTKVDMYHRS